MGWIEDAGNFVQQNVVQPAQNFVNQNVVQPVSQVVTQSQPVTSNNQPYVSGSGGGMYNPTPISAPVQNQINTMSSPISGIMQIPQTINNVGAGIGNTINSGITQFSNAISPAVNTIGQGITQLPQNISSGLSMAGSGIQQIPQQINTGLSGISQQIPSSIGSGLQGISMLSNPTTIPLAIASAAPMISGISNTLGNTFIQPLSNAFQNNIAPNVVGENVLGFVPTAGLDIATRNPIFGGIGSIFGTSPNVTQNVALAVGAQQAQFNPAIAVPLTIPLEIMGEGMNLAGSFMVGKAPAPFSSVTQPATQFVTGVVTDPLFNPVSTAGNLGIGVLGGVLINGLSGPVSRAAEAYGAAKVAGTSSLLSWDALGAGAQRIGNFAASPVGTAVMGAAFEGSAALGALQSTNPVSSFGGAQTGAFAFGFGMGYGMQGRIGSDLGTVKNSIVDTGSYLTGVESNIKAGVSDLGIFTPKEVAYPPGWNFERVDIGNGQYLEQFSSPNQGKLLFGINQPTATAGVEGVEGTNIGNLAVPTMQKAGFVTGLQEPTPFNTMAKAPNVETGSYGAGNFFEDVPEATKPRQVQVIDLTNVNNWLNPTEVLKGPADYVFGTPKATSTYNPNFAEPSGTKGISLFNNAPAAPGVGEEAIYPNVNMANKFMADLTPGNERVINTPVKISEDYSAFGQDITNTLSKTGGSAGGGAGITESQILETPEIKVLGKSTFEINQPTTLRESQDVLGYNKGLADAFLRPESRGAALVGSQAISSGNVINFGVPVYLTSGFTRDNYPTTVPVAFDLSNLPKSGESVQYKGEAGMGVFVMPNLDLSGITAGVRNITGESTGNRQSPLNIQNPLQDVNNITGLINPQMQDTAQITDQLLTPRTEQTRVTEQREESVFNQVRVSDFDFGRVEVPVYGFVPNVGVGVGNVPSVTNVGQYNVPSNSIYNIPSTGSSINNIFNPVTSQLIGQPIFPTSGNNVANPQAPSLIYNVKGGDTFMNGFPVPTATPPLFPFSMPSPRGGYPKEMGGLGGGGGGGGSGGGVMSHLFGEIAPLGSLTSNLFGL